MKALIAAAVSLIAAAPALANPWDKGGAPSHAMRPDWQSRVAVDGRGETQDAHVRVERDAAPRPEAAKPQNHADPVGDRMGRPAAPPPAPMKTQITLRLQGEESPEGVQKAQAATTEQQAKPSTDLMGRREAPPPVPMKTQIMLRLQGEESPEAAANNQKAQGNHEQKDANGQTRKRPHSREELKSFTKHTGLSLPFDPQGSDQADDKAE